MPDFLHHAPRVIPPLSAMLADLGHPTPARLGRLFATHPRTVRRWITADRAPRAVLLGLFWLTRWGLSQVESRAVNDARLAAAQARAALDALQLAEKQNAHLLQVGAFGSANDPVRGPAVAVGAAPRA